MSPPPLTLYQIADAEIRECIKVYLNLVRETAGLSTIQPEHLASSRAKEILLAGLNVQNLDLTAEEAQIEWQRRQAIPFDLESAISFGG